MFKITYSKFSRRDSHLNTTIKLGERCVSQGLASARERVQISSAEKLIEAFIRKKGRAKVMGYVQQMALTKDAIVL